MRIGIDAGNTRTGGGLTYLSEMMKAVEPRELRVDSVVVWGNRAALAEMPNRPWLNLRHERAHDGRFYSGFLWQRRELQEDAVREKCDLLFFPGSTYLGNFSPFVAVSQNMLPFSPVERARYGLSWTRIRLKLLQYTQSRTFRRAAGMIFLTQWAKLGIETYTRKYHPRARIIPHGISERFRRQPPAGGPPQEYTAERPFRWLYISIVAPYKHQWNVAAAVAGLRAQGYPMTVDFVGPAYQPSLEHLKRTLAAADPSGEHLRYHGPVPYNQLHKYYHGSDGFVFATTCENLPNILIEAMSAGLPIASSRLGPMPEVLGDGGLYFDPEDVEEMKEVLVRLFRSQELRERCAVRAARRASQYSWSRCARETFSFLAQVAKMRAPSRRGI